MAKRNTDILSTQDISEHTDFKEQTVRKVYMHDKTKQNTYEALQVGAYAKKMGLTMNESRKAIMDMKSTKDMLNG